MRKWIVSWMPRLVVATVVVTVLEIVFWPTLDLSLPKMFVSQGTLRTTAVVDSVQGRAIQAQSAVAQAIWGSPSRPDQPSQLPTVEPRPTNSGRVSFLTSTGTRFFGRSGSVQKVDGHQVVIQPAARGAK